MSDRSWNATISPASRCSPTSGSGGRPSSAQTMWGAVSRAVRMPTRFDTDLRIRLAEQRPAAAHRHRGLPVGNRRRLRGRVSGASGGMGVDRRRPLFANDYDHLRSQELPQRAGDPLVLANGLNARTSGVEIAATVIVSPRWQAHASYSYLRERFSRDAASRDLSGGVNEGERPVAPVFRALVLRPAAQRRSGRVPPRHQPVATAACRALRRAERAAGLAGAPQLGAVARRAEPAARQSRGICRRHSARAVRAKRVRQIGMAILRAWRLVVVVCGISAGVSAADRRRSGVRPRRRPQGGVPLQLREIRGMAGIARSAQAIGARSNSASSPSRPSSRWWTKSSPARASTAGRSSG